MHFHYGEKSLYFVYTEWFVLCKLLNFASFVSSRGGRGHLDHCMGQCGPLSKCIFIDMKSGNDVIIPFSSVCAQVVCNSMDTSPIYGLNSMHEPLISGSV